MRPVLVTGGNRTGTSWVGRVLCLSGELFYVWEPFNSMFPLPLLGHPLWRHYRRVLPGEAPAVRRHVRAKTLYDLVSNAAGGRGIGRKLLKVGRICNRLAGWLSGGKAPLYKDPIALMSAEWLSRTFRARVVMTVRHPGAYVNSIRRLDWPMCVEEFASQPRVMESLPEELREEISERIARRPRPSGYVLEDAALCWKVFHRVVYDYGRKHPEWVTVRHEDLSMDYIRAFGGLYERLGLTWRPAVARKVHRLCRRENPTFQNDPAHHLVQDSAALTRVWKHRLDPEEQSRIRSITEPVASLFYDGASWG
jgi:hypothetical protein